MGGATTNGVETNGVRAFKTNGVRAFTTLTPMGGGTTNGGRAFDERGQGRRTGSEPFGAHLPQSLHPTHMPQCLQVARTNGVSRTNGVRTNGVRAFDEHDERARTGSEAFREQNGVRAFDGAFDERDQSLSGHT